MKIYNNLEIKDVDEDTLKNLQNFDIFKSGAVKISPLNLYLPAKFKDAYKDVYEFKDRKEDVFVISFTKVGSTWLQEVVWTILHNKNLDNPKQFEDAYLKTPFFEGESWAEYEKIPDSMNQLMEAMSWKAFETMSNPRVFKSHMHFNLLNPNLVNNNKFVYVIRDPCDTFFSLFNFARSIKLMNYSGTLENMVDLFINGYTIYGSYVDHLKQWWKERNRENIYTIFYEDMRKNTEIEIEKLSTFLGVALTKEQIQNVMDYTSMKEMRKRDLMTTGEAKNMINDHEGASSYFRKGEVGEGSKVMTEEMVKKIKKYMRDNIGEMELPYNISD